MTQAVSEGALAVALTHLGVELAPEALATIQAHANLVRIANQRLNLTRITDGEAVAVLHVADSLACLLALPQEAKLSLVDVGSGAGYPGLVLAAARPEWRVTLVESSGKKAAFLDETVRELGLAARVEVLCARAEEVGRMPDRRQNFDVAVARAVAPLPVLVEYLLPLVRRGGVALAMRGHSADEEIVAATRAIGLLGGDGVRTVSYELPSLNASRQLVLMEKRRATPAAYPRRPGIPERQPLA